MATADEIWALALTGTPAGTVLADATPLARDLHHVHGLRAGEALVVTTTSREAADVSQSIDLTAGVTTVTRLP